MLKVLWPVPNETDSGEMPAETSLCPVVGDMEVASGRLSRSGTRVVLDPVWIVPWEILALSDDAACSVDVSSGRVLLGMEGEGNPLAKKVEKLISVDGVLVSAAVLLAWLPSRELLSVSEVVGAVSEAGVGCTPDVSAGAVFREGRVFVPVTLARLLLAEMPEVSDSLVTA